MQVKDTNKNRRNTAVLAGVCLVLQLAVAPHILLGNGCANFALVFAGILALSMGGRVGVLAGFGMGLLYDFTATTPIGLMSLLFTVFCYVLGSEKRNRFGDGLVSSLTTFSIGALCVLLSYHMAMLMLGQAEGFYDVLVLRTLPSFALTFIAFLPFAYLQVRSTSKVHGRSKGASSSHRGSQHYDVSNL